ncbi:plastocyanin/azurin family copper-binding protein [Salarchaeum sp. JOR-1]|uniref:cupredoxin domain-containing protein n=1 Tax=Salarchaeum sp. JOR-1 TaxID=2599399 RepID=UPI0011989651|nr:plastocyanin/azurin family copper-binding protein [Salarchaeum sp. JOR-1]QDX41310.1 halocyanin [Salarchaeum sp. JOR-1]
MDRRSFLAAVGAVGATGVVAGAASVLADSTDYDVAMRSNAFAPVESKAIDVPADAPGYIPTGVPTIEVEVGEPVTWLNTGTRYHTVTGESNAIPDSAEYFASGGFESEAAAWESFETDVGGGGAILPSESYTHVFDVPGWYHYYCIPHLPAGMVGNVRVVEK